MAAESCEKLLVHLLLTSDRVELPATGWDGYLSSCQSLHTVIHLDWLALRTLSVNPYVSSLLYQIASPAAFQKGGYVMWNALNVMSCRHLLQISHIKLNFHWLNDTKMDCASRVWKNTNCGHIIPKDPAVVSLRKRNVSNVNLEYSTRSKWGTYWVLL